MHRYTGQAIMPSALKDVAPLTQPYRAASLLPAERLEGNLLYRFSKVIGKEATCPRVEFKAPESGESDDSPPVIRWPERKKLPPGGSHFREELFSSSNGRSPVQRRQRLSTMWYRTFLVASPWQLWCLYIYDLEECRPSGRRVPRHRCN